MEKSPQLGDESDVALVFRIPWGHNKLIIDKCKGDRAKALFFVKETLSNNWSRAVLMNFVKDRSEVIPIPSPVIQWVTMINRSEAR
ncbi:MAG: DUF1016 N-terminal domain-containing protein [Candidatus Weimeria sp.]